MAGWQTGDLIDFSSAAVLTASDTRAINNLYYKSTFVWESLTIDYAKLRTMLDQQRQNDHMICFYEHEKQYPTQLRTE